MKLDQIQIRTQDTNIQINTSQSNQYIKQTAAKQTIRQPAATVEMSSTDAKLLVDSSQAYRDLGLLSAKEAIQQAAQKGKQAVMAGIARTANEGNMMMDLKNADGVKVLANIAKQRDTFVQQKLGIEWKPSVGSVKITYRAGDLNINTQQRKPQIDVQLGDVIHNYTPGKVTGNILQHASVETTVIKGE